MFDSIFEDVELKNFISSKINDPWKGTNFEGYVHMQPVHKGKFGELFVSRWLEVCGLIVECRVNTGHDIIVNCSNTEVKFGLANRDKFGNIVQDSFIINHISEGKDWERLIVCGINENEKDIRIFWFSKEDFCDYLKTNQCIFSHQQGGKEIENDDYMCKNMNELRKLKFIRGIEEW
jgi:hypothetical protein